MGLEERGVGGAGQERRVAQHIDEQVAVGTQSVQAGSGQRVGEYLCGTGPGRCVGDHLGQHRVIVDGHHRPVGNARVQPDSGSVGQVEVRCGRGDVEVVNGPRLGLPSAPRVLGVKPGLDGMPDRAGRLGGQSLPVGDGHLPLHQVESGGQFGDRVLDLQSGVHLQEVELAGPLR